jgi:Flp pilus assembly protein protease CpaA
MAGTLEIGVWCLFVLASITDIKNGKIYNGLTFPFFFLGIALQVYLKGLHSIPSIGLSVVTAALLFFPLYFSKILAAGDVKLILAASTWLNSDLTLKLAGLSILVGAFVGLLISIFKNGLSNAISNLLNHLKPGSKKNSTRIPFAPAFLCAFSILKIAEARGW